MNFQQDLSSTMNGLIYLNTNNENYERWNNERGN